LVGDGEGGAIWRQSQGDDAWGGLIRGCGAWEVEGGEAVAEEGMIASEICEAVVPVGVDEGGVEGGDERRGEGGGDAVAVGPCA